MRITGPVVITIAAGRWLQGLLRLIALCFRCWRQEHDAQQRVIAAGAHLIAWRGRGERCGHAGMAQVKFMRASRYVAGRALAAWSGYDQLTTKEAARGSPDPSHGH
jgi:hypothetical protein